MPGSPWYHTDEQSTGVRAVGTTYKCAHKNQRCSSLYIGLMSGESVFLKINETYMHIELL